jgi:hypothetical protein
MLTRRIIPDISFNQSTAATPDVTLCYSATKLSQARTAGRPVGYTKHTYNIQTDVFTDQVFIRARARQMALRVASDTEGVQWQLGSPRLDVRPDGRR